MQHPFQQPAFSLVIGWAILLAAVGAGPATRPAAPADAADAPAAAVAGKADPKAGAAAPAPAPAPVPVPAERLPLAPVGVVRELRDQEYSNAVEARDAADLMRAAYEKAHRAGAAGKAGAPKAAAEDDTAAFAPVVGAYRQAIGRYPGTEIEHYCRLALAGAYQYRGQFDLALNEAKQAAERFGGTKQGMGAVQSVALIYLQAMHDPNQAAIWFRQLQTAAGTLQDDSERLKWQTAAAQGLARCDAERGAGKK